MRGARYFGQVAHSLWHSRRFNQLNGPTPQLAFVYLLASKHFQPVGLFQFPAPYLTADLKVIENNDHADQVLDDLEAAGLIERQEDWVRVVKLFQTMPPFNASVVTGGLKVLQDRAVPRGDLRTRTLVDLIYSGLETSQGWKPDTGPLNDMVQTIDKVLRVEVERDSKQLVKALKHNDLEMRDPVWSQHWQYLSELYPQAKLDTV